MKPLSYHVPLYSAGSPREEHYATEQTLKRRKTHIAANHRRSEKRQPISVGLRLRSTDPRTPGSGFPPSRVKHHARPGGRRRRPHGVPTRPDQGLAFGMVRLQSLVGPLWFGLATPLGTGGGGRNGARMGRPSLGPCPAGAGSSEAINP